MWDEQPAAVHSEQPAVCTQTLLMVCTAEQLCPSWLLSFGEAPVS